MVAEWLFLGAGCCWFRLRKVGSVVMALWLVLTFRLGSSGWWSWVVERSDTTDHSVSSLYVEVIPQGAAWWFKLLPLPSAFS